MSAHLTICFDPWQKNPVFHEWAGYDVGRMAPFTHCGRTVDADSWRIARLRRDHAQRIGRPCKACLKKGMPWVFRFTTSHQNWSNAS